MSDDSKRAIALLFAIAVLFFSCLWLLEPAADLILEILAFYEQ